MTSASSSARPILLIGGVPAPVGGVTQHVAQLASEAVRRGYCCEVIDVLGPRPIQPLPGVTVHLVPGGAARVTGLLRLLLARPQAIRHYHISEGDRFIPISPLLLLTKRGGADICTIHSGAISSRYESMNGIKKAVLAWSLRQMTRIVSLTPHITDFLQNRIGIPAGRIVPASSFVGSAAQPDPAALDPGLRSIRESADSIFVTSGYMQALYRYEDFIASVEHARSNGRDVHGVIVAYGTSDPEYWSRIVQAVSERPFLHIAGPQRHESFLALLAAADLYIRPTSSDSCGVAVHEAIAVGTPAVATDVCLRAAGTILVPYGNRDALFEAVSAALAAGRPDPAVNPDSDPAAPVFRMYLQLGAAPSLPTSNSPQPRQ